MSRRTVILLLVVGGLVLGAFVWTDRPEGDAQTDRSARIVADAVSWPRRETATALLNAVLDTTAAKADGLTVVRAQDLKAESLTDPFARLVFHYHRDGGQLQWLTGGRSKPMDACYRAEFSYYGADPPPVRIDCPRDLTPLESRPQPSPSGKPVRPLIKGAPETSAP